MSNEFHEKMKTLFTKTIHSFCDYDYKTGAETNIYKILPEERRDFRHYEVYSIDPDDCEDADDAFSIYEENEQLYLAIHIADPTEYLFINDPLWNGMMRQSTTKYPLNAKAFHLLPHSILQEANLKTNASHSETKNAISIITKINKSTYECEDVPFYYFTRITIKKENAFTYREASIMDHDVITLGLKISQQMHTFRSTKTKGVVLNELSLSYPKFGDNGYIYLHKDAPEERKMKQMIAEFAIFANAFVGQYLKDHLNIGIFRTCDIGTHHFSETVTPTEMLKDIVTNKIQANYQSQVHAHDLVGLPEYCHFTSPMRRMSDCVCHFLLKYIHLRRMKQLPCPFDEKELDDISQQCYHAVKQDKKNQYLDTKFRILQSMVCYLQTHESLKLKYYETSYTGLFLNLTICGIDEHDVYFSYTLRRKYVDFVVAQQSQIQEVMITKVYSGMKFDEGTIPELDRLYPPDLCI